MSIRDRVRRYLGVGEILERIETMSAALQARIDAMSAAVQANTDADDAMTKVLVDNNKLLAEAIAAAKTAGATDAQLQALTDLETTLAASTAKQVDATLANTPAA